MKKKIGKNAARLSAMLLALLLAVTAAGCQTATPTAQTQAPAAETATPATPAAPEPELKFEEEITIDYYFMSSNFQGIVDGWVGKALKDKFNMKVNTISPNISGEAIFQTRSAAGHLGDIVAIDVADLANAVKAELLLEMSGLIETRGGNLKAPKFTRAIENLKSTLDLDGVYAIPTEVCSLSPTAPFPSYSGAMGCTQTGGAPYLRYDLYKAVGSPEMKTMEDLLPVIQKMQQANPTSATGRTVYGFSLFKDWDGEAMKAIWESFPTMYGYQFSPGTSTVLTYGDPTTFKTQRLDDDAGLYYRTLKFYFQANQMGLVDPDSPAQNWDTMCTKMEDGQILFYFWSWASMGQYNDKNNGNADQPTGFEFVPIADQMYYDTGYQPLGVGGAVGIGSKAKDPERMMAFLNWCGSPEGMEIQLNGPRGLLWDIVDGQPVLTEFGKQAELDDSLAVPEEFGGGTIKGNDVWHTARLLHWDEINPNTNTPYKTNTWPSVMEEAATKLDKMWRQDYGANDMLDYIQKHNMLAVAPGNGYVSPTDSGDIETMRTQCSKAVIDASWQMVFAKDQAAFDSLWANLKEQLKGLGWESLVEVDMQRARDYNAACMETINSSK